MKTAALVLLLFVANVASAQRGGQPAQRVCVLVWNDLPPTNHQNFVQTQTRKYIVYFGGGFRARCQGTNMRVFSDSAEYSEDLEIMTLIGNARYTEEGTSMTANLMRYNQNQAQLTAEGSVKVTMQSGSTLQADILQYLRKMPPVRGYVAADASGNTRLVMRDSAAVPDSAATEIRAARLHMLRDSLFYAGGQVVITRPDVIGTSDSAETNSNRRTARLTGGNPRFSGRGDRTFTIDGNILDIFGRERELERLLARGDAVAVSDSLTLKADTLDLRTNGTLIDRVEAWGPGRAQAVSPGRDIRANRLVIAMPGQKIQDLRAYGDARAETTPDSTVVTTERDWIEGDTLTALFDQTANQRETSQPPMRSLIAQGAARSFYQQRTSKQGCNEPTLNYVTGRRIEVRFVTGRVNEVEVTSNVRGMTATPCTTVTDSVPPRRGNSR
jgi:lipopolysaccharide export system protein LptA